MILIGPTGRLLSVPKHRVLGRGLLRALIRDTGLTREAFIELLEKVRLVNQGVSDRRC